MKRLIYVALLSLALLTFQTEKIQAAAKHPPVTVTFQVFYDQLSPYGNWVDYPGYGYAWIPSVGGGFTPYGTNGHWVYTNMGWTWASNYNWGWAPFHYGRWIYDSFYGWVWVPDYTWAPSWVVWGYYDGYYGWAPLAPGIYYSAGYRPPARCWTFVPQQHITQVNVYNYHVQNNTTIYNNVTIVNNSATYNNQQYFSGPRVTDVEKNTGKRITPHTVTASSKPGATLVRDNQIATYRPTIERSPQSKPAPANARKLDNVKPVNTQNKAVSPSNSGKSDVGGKQNVTPGGSKQPVQQQKVTPNQGQPRSAPDRNVSPSGKPNVEQRNVPQQKVNPQQRNVSPSGKPNIDQRSAPSQQQRVDPQQRENPQQRLNPSQQRENPQPQQKVNPQQRENPQMQQRNVAPQQQQRVVPQNEPQRNISPQPRGNQGMQQQQQAPPSQQMQPRQFNQTPAPQQRMELNQQPQQQSRPMPQGGGGGQRKVIP
jgi:hypothetical protein